MKSYYSLAWKELLTQKIMAVLILISIILSTMMTTVIGQSIGILNAMRQNQAAGLNGNRYATLHQLTQNQADEISADNRLSYAERTISPGLVDIPNSKLNILLNEYEGNALSAYPDDGQLESGRLPQQAGEIALPGDALSLLNYNGELGGTITLPIHISLRRDTMADYEYTGEFVLTGILKPNYVGYVSGTVKGIVGEGTAKSFLPDRYQVYSLDIRTVDKKTFQNTIDDLIETYHIPDYLVQYNDILLSALGISYNAEEETDTASGFSYMTAAGLLIGALVLLAAGLVIYNILKIAVAKRIKEYGTLRAIGAERNKLYALVAIQLVILCGIGIPMGCLLGMLSAKGILTAATGFFNPDVFLATAQSDVAEMVDTNGDGKILPLIISAVITLAFAFLAAMPAARYASKVSPTTAMSGQSIRVKRKNRKAGHIRNFEAFYARMNMKRNKGRTAITILSLVMSITVFVALQSFSGILDTSAGIEQMHHGDYSMTSQAAGFSKENLTEIQNISGIEHISTLKYSLYQSDREGNWEGIETSVLPKPGETIQIVSVDYERLAAIVPSLSENDLQAIKDGTSCLVQNPMALYFGDEAQPSTVLSVGESIAVNGENMSIVGIMDNPITLENEGFINGIQIVVSDEIYNRLTRQDCYTELYLTVADHGDRDAIEASMEEICQSAGGTWMSYENTDSQLKESYEQIRLLAWGLIVFVGLIGILNIINTVYTNIHTRITEIGVQRAIGMSAGSLYKTFLWEGAYYGIIAVIVGGIAGYICTIFISAAATDTVQLVAVPVLTMIEAAVFSIAACLIATCVPLRKVSKMNIVSAIENVE